MELCGKHFFICVHRIFQWLTSQCITLQDDMNFEGTATSCLHKSNFRLTYLVGIFREMKFTLLNLACLIAQIRLWHIGLAQLSLLACMKWGSSSTKFCIWQRSYLTRPCYKNEAMCHCHGLFAESLVCSTLHMSELFYHTNNASSGIRFDVYFEILSLSLSNWSLN